MITKFLSGVTFGWVIGATFWMMFVENVDTGFFLAGGWFLFTVTIISYAIRGGRKADK